MRGPFDAITPAVLWSRESEVSPLASDHPKAFVCHASEDKERFAVPLARKLRASGVDAWLDGWEIDYGEGLLEKISAGIHDAGFFVFVATPTSISKPRVKAELEGGFAKHLRGGARLITLVLDRCADQLPELLRGRRYMEVCDPTNVYTVVEEFKARLDS